MRDTFHRDLEQLDQDVVRMGALVEAAIEGATIALAEGDIERANRVKAGDDEIDELFLDIEKRALTMLAQQQPVAGDLRLIVTILLAVNDLERSGDLAYNIASVVREDLDIVNLRKVSTLVYELGNAARRLLARSLDAWADKNLDIACQMDELDDEIDELYERLFRELFELQKETSFDIAMNLVLVGRYFERIADHGVNLAERMRYFITGNEEHLG
jgi:phosphate transport system protein